MNHGIGPFEARLRQPDAERPDEKVDGCLHHAPHIIGGEGWSMLRRGLPQRRGDGIGAVDRAGESAHAGISVDVAHGDPRFRR